MNLIKTSLDGVVLLETHINYDSRGFFTETYNKSLFFKKELNFNFIQDNQSKTLEAGVIRGLHYQDGPNAQTKLLRVLTGAIFDVVVDLRKNSSTFGKWISVIISEYNNRQILIPKGFAHGFCTIVPNTIVIYKVDEHYSKSHSKGIIWNDKTLNINWPVTNPILSEQDLKLPNFKDINSKF
ncbi:dTDP-4-dehydrorhamnose 3,5-epimerase [Metabacillus halosaccharovorans]|nr:dTDP-4-dehydrorhamnose 3,5-epimerase [Metabacillus halosaccharovorans]